MSESRPSTFLEHDSEGMLAATLALPDHLERALSEPQLGVAPGEGHELSRAHHPRAVVVLGMGGSGIAGAILEAFCRSRSQVPVVTVAGYEAPSFVDSDVLVVAVSFSGETEETLEAASSCLDAGAPTIAITTGGSLAELVSNAGGRVLQIQGGIPQPRAGIGAMTAPLLLVCEELGVVGGARKELEHSVRQLRRRLEELAGGEGVAREVADRIGRTIPLAHGADGLGAVAARRFKTQVNENAKAPCFSGVQPEICHNEICGFGQAGDVTRQLLTLVELRLAREHPQVATRFRLVANILDEVVVDVVTMQAEGVGDLACFFDLVAIGDMVSLHLAAREGIDPGPVPVLNEVKAGLRER